MTTTKKPYKKWKQTPKAPPRDCDHAYAMVFPDVPTGEGEHCYCRRCGQRWVWVYGGSGQQGWRPLLSGRS